MIAAAVIIIVTNRFFQPRREENVRSAGRGASLASRPCMTSPIILGRIDAAGADRGVVERANIGNTNFAAKKIVEMDVDFSRSVDGNVHVLVADHVLGNDRATNGRAAISAVDVNSHAAGRSCIKRIGEVAGNEVANDLVSVHVVRRSSESRTHMGM